MSNGMTIDQLYEAFMDIDEFGDPLETKTPFAEDVFGFFGKDKLGGLGKQEWAARYEMYFPTFDPAQTYLAERERDLSYRSAMDTLKTTQEETDRVYSTEMDTLSTTLGRELSKGREMAGRIGLRSGDLESAIQDTIATTGSKAKDFGDRVMISEEEIDNKYNNAMVDAALDYDKTVRQEKEEFYDRTMAAIMRLIDTEAFAKTTSIVIPDGTEITPLEEDFNEFSEGYQECAAYCQGDDDCMYDCAAAAGEGTTFFDEFFHTDYESVYGDLSDLSGIDDDEFVNLVETLEQNPIVNALCCAKAWAKSYGPCLSLSAKRTADCQKRKQAEACGSC